MTVREATENNQVLQTRAHRASGRQTVQNGIGLGSPSNSAKLRMAAWVLWEKMLGLISNVCHRPHIGDIHVLAMLKLAIHVLPTV